MDANKSDHRNHLNLQIDLLAEKEVTKMLQLLRLVCMKLEIEEVMHDEELEDMLNTTSIDQVAERIRHEMPPKAEGSAIEELAQGVRLGLSIAMFALRDMFLIQLTECFDGDGGIRNIWSLVIHVETSGIQLGSIFPAPVNASRLIEHRRFHEGKIDAGFKLRLRERSDLCPVDG